MAAALPAVMRSVFVAIAFVVAVPSCAAEVSPPPAKEERPREATPDDLSRDPSSSGGGGTPSNVCGETASASAVGCGLLDIDAGRYCSDYRASPNSVGKCLASFTTGTMNATIGGAAFSATRVGARRLTNDVVEIAGFSAPNASSSNPDEPGEGLRLTIAATGAGQCYSLGFTETRTGPVWMSWFDIGSCSFELTDDGAASGVVTGTFTATVRQSALADAPSRDIVNGSFSVTLAK